MKTVKYTFDNRFDAPSKVKEPDAPPPSFSEDELAAARQAGYEEGLEAGRAEVLADIEHRMATAASNIAAAAGALAAEHEDRRAASTAEAAAVAHAIARTLAPALAAREPLTEIEEMVRECLTVSYAEPRLVIRVAEDLVERMKTIVDRIAHEQSFAGKIILLGDERLTGDQCRVEWADGGAERNREELQTEVDRLVERHLNSLSKSSMEPAAELAGEMAMQQESENADVE